MDWRLLLRPLVVVTHDFTREDKESKDLDFVQAAIFSGSCRRTVVRKRVVFVSLTDLSGNDGNLYVEKALNVTQRSANNYA